MDDLATQLLEWLKTEIWATIIAVVALSLCCCGSVAAVFWGELENGQTQPDKVKTFEPNNPRQKPANTRKKQAESPPKEPDAQTRQAAATEEDANRKRAKDPASQPLDPSWVESQWIRFRSDEECPEAWSDLLPEDASGDGQSAGGKGASAPDELGPKLARRTFVTRLPVQDIELSEYDYDERAFTAEVPTLLECTSERTVQVALDEPQVVVKQTNPQESGEKIELTRTWNSTPFTFLVPIPETEAVEFRRVWDSAKNTPGVGPRNDFEILVAFTVDEVRNDRDKERASELLPREGAGPIVNAERLHTRVMYKDVTLLDTKKRRVD